MFMMRFWPITARPISAISPLGSIALVALIQFSLKGETIAEVGGCARINSSHVERGRVNRILCRGCAAFPLARNCRLDRDGGARCPQRAGVRCEQVPYVSPIPARRGEPAAPYRVRKNSRPPITQLTPQSASAPGLRWHP